VLRQEGIRVPGGATTSFPKRVRLLQMSEELASAVAPLLTSHEQLCEQIKQIDAKIELSIEHDERAKRLTTVPSVGSVTALTFIALVDDIARSRVFLRRDSSAAISAWFLASTAQEKSSNEATSPRLATPDCARCWSSAPGEY